VYLIHYKAKPITSNEKLKISNVIIVKYSVILIL
jgi:hypothetical protein